jgi:type 1 fimbria pilin
MKKVFIFFGVLLSLIPLSAQSLAPEVVATSGNSFSSSGATIEFTVGEVTTNTLSGGGNTLTQGFHQPEIHFFSIDKNEDEFTFNLYPNPTDQYVTVASTTEEVLQVHIYATSGQAIEVSNVFTKQITLDLQSMASGSYIMIITNASGKPLKNYTIIKK